MPDYALAYELHELTPIKIIKCTGFYLDENVFHENVFPDIFAILLIFFEFIRVIRGLTLYLGLCPPAKTMILSVPIEGFERHYGI
ncbi:MAG: hypothetical protein GXO78_01575 [Calditrichaeota bacterium]|nr:hypothetical protein [Calditrichota bacterium]